MSDPRLSGRHSLPSLKGSWASACGISSASDVGLAQPRQIVARWCHQRRPGISSPNSPRARQPPLSLDQGELTEGHELDRKWRVPKEMIGRRLSQEEAKRLLRFSYSFADGDCGNNGDD